jgi:regulator of sigma E protease
MLAQPPVWLVVLAFIAAIGPLVFFHELGHFTVGRLFGVGAEVFSIGFGREIAGWTDRTGTRWKIGWLPLGGYVRFVGDESRAGEGEGSESAQDPRSFAGKPVWQRFLIVLAGPAANFLLAILIFAAFFALIGAPLTNAVGDVVPNSPAASAGLKSGDRILSIAGRETPTFVDISNVVSLRPHESVRLTYRRGESIRQAQVTLSADMMDSASGQQVERGVLGIYPSSEIVERVSPLKAVPMAVEFTARLTGAVVDGIVQVFRGAVSPKQIGGPIAIAKSAGEGASLGLLPFIQLLALLSINLGFINLLPVPLLDGGHLVFYAVEAVRRRPVSVRAQEWAFRGGLALILALLLFTTANDLGSLGLWDSLGRLIG